MAAPESLDDATFCMDIDIAALDGFDIQAEQVYSM